ncbi:MAG TPA: TIGR01777 family oxidoreductase, partial [Thermodesulfobacteriota bacterium]
MKIFVTGGTGFVGKTLAPALVRTGHEVSILTRSGKGETSGVSWIEGDPTQKGKWQEAVKEHGVVINLAGASLFTRWTEEAKRMIRDSRILTTRHLLEAMDGGKGKTFFSTSAIGYYGFHGDENLTEDSPPGGDFLALLARDWEAEAKEAEKKGCRVVITRFGIVLGEKGGALGQMIPLFNKYVGGPLGSGKQWFSWIHIEDLTRAFLFLLEHPEISGPVNFTAPNPVRNKELAQWLGRILGRPAFLPAPGFMLRLVLGEFGSILLEGQRVLPQKLVQAGFQFSYPEIDRALR